MRNSGHACVRRFILSGVIAVAVAVGTAYGDGGSIPFVPHAKIFEPTQRAMIAWNGEEEILLLSTDLRASEPTKVLEVFPFPSEPRVKKGDIELFQKAVTLINRKLGARDGYGAAGGPSPGMSGGAGAPLPPPARVTFHEQIGAHDVSVIQMVRLRGFVGWVENYLKAQHVDNPVIPRPLAEVVEEYIQDGFGWFVFDVASLTDKPVTLTSRELRDLSEEMDGLLGRPESAKLRIWEILGALSEFKQDLVMCYPSWRLQKGQAPARQTSSTLRTFD